MSHFTRRLVVGALIVSAAAIGASPADAAKGGTDRPFSATGAGTNIIAEIPPPPPTPFPPGACVPSFGERGLQFDCDQTIELDFKGTHLGKSTYTAVGTIVLYVDEGCFTPGGGFGITFESSTAGTIIAANGDALTADVAVSGCGDGETVALPSGTYTITGGTGRFADATGEGTVEAVADGEALSNKWAGTISY
jgi:hypothetical protein